MARCAHGNSAPSNILMDLPICQAGSGRHKCAVCAYAAGLKASQGKMFPGPVEECDQGHDNAPLAMLTALPKSQAGIERHKCAYRAYQLGKLAGRAIADADGSDAADDKEEANILARTDIEVTQKEQLVLARRGQGLFRERVLGLAPKCRVTGIDDKRFLIASHIKPWRVSSDAERLDGYNGLLLAPHADLLFDKGWLTFEMTGAVVYSPQLPTGVWEAWKLGAYQVKQPFDKRYSDYLEYHRTEVFRA